MNETALNSLYTDLKAQLPGFATVLINNRADSSLPASQSFAANPNDPLQHAPAWHQYGIIEHSERFHESLKTSVLDYVEQWGLSEAVQAVLSEEIDGVSKGSLLLVTGLLHDIGKFTGRKTIELPDGTSKTTFEDHEAESGRVIRENPIKQYLATHGLSERQIEYIARTAELHFELGKMRRVAKATAAGFTIAFTETPEFEEAIQEIIHEHADFAVEIGLLFIADGMSKSEDFSTATNDEAIEAERSELENSLAVKGLNRELIAQALQVPVNLRVAQRYLQTWLTLRKYGS